MPIPQRILALGLFGVFGVSVFAQLAAGPTHRGDGVSPPLLPAAHANPAEVGFQDTLQAGETLSQLLQRAHLAAEEADALLSGLKEVQDPRRLHPGSVISWRRSVTSGVVRGVELKLDADRTLNMARAAGSWEATVEEVPVRADTVVLTGVVETSLYSALVDGEGSGVPADERRLVADILAERIFAWQVDFSRDLRRGDEFRILYERMARPDGTARSGRVLSAQFSINDRDFEAYACVAPDGTEGYYDREGESLRRAFLRAPLEFRRISSAFSKGRFHPVLKKSRAHHGIDYAASSGTPVRAVGDGVVKRAGWGGGYGNLIELRHKNGYATRYAHLKGFARGVHSGVRVQQGDVIGYVGSTGLSTGPHLHFEFHMAGRPVDPDGVKLITGDPVPNRYRAAYREHVVAQIATLDRASARILLADATPPASEQAGDRG